jgi:hypothetical protein
MTSIKTTGSCHCGNVRVMVPHAPTDVTECHCSICRRYAGLWAYYPVGEVTFVGHVHTYVWGRRYISYQRCSNCGCVVGWLPLGEYPDCGVNVRMLDDFDASQVRIVIEDDASE